MCLASFFHFEVHFGAFGVIFREFCGTRGESPKIPAKFLVFGGLLEPILAPGCPEMAAKSANMSQDGANIGLRKPT
jgi:hypothetical protein